MRNKKGQRSRGTRLWVADGPAGICVLHDLFSSSCSAAEVMGRAPTKKALRHRDEGHGLISVVPPWLKGRIALPNHSGAITGANRCRLVSGRGSPAMLTGEFGPAGRAGTPRGHWWWACTRWSHLAAGMAYCSCSTHGIFLVSLAHWVGLGRVTGGASKVNYNRYWGIKQGWVSWTIAFGGRWAENPGFPRRWSG